jgi:hypothetical protein
MYGFLMVLPFIPQLVLSEVEVSSICNPQFPYLPSVNLFTRKSGILIFFIFACVFSMS